MERVKLPYAVQTIISPMAQPRAPGHSRRADLEPVVAGVSDL